MEQRRIAVVTAGLREPSSTRMLADRLSDATAAALRELAIEPDVTVIEVRDHAQELINHLFTGFPSADLAETIERVVRADGIIAVTPVFSGSYSGLFKTFFDVLDKDVLAATPVLLGATGGTPRHSLVLDHALRPLFAYLRALALPTAVYAATEDWGGGAGDAHEGLVARIDRAGAELAAAVASRPRADVVDEFSDPVPFEELLRPR